MLGISTESESCKMTTKYCNEAIESWVNREKMVFFMQEGL